MQSRNQPVRKTKDKHGPELKALLSLRAAFILTVAVLAGLGAAGLLYVAHRPAAQVTLGAVGVFCGALKLLDSMIE